MEFDPNKPFNVVEEVKSVEFDPTKPFEKEGTSIPESLLRGVASVPFASNIEARVRSAFSDKTYEQELEESQRSFREAEEDNPNAFLAGDVASYLLPFGGVYKYGGKILKGAAKALGSGVKGTAKLGNKAVEKIAKETGLEAESIKDMGTAAIDIFGGTGGAATIARNAAKTFKAGNKSLPNASKELADKVAATKALKAETAASKANRASLKEKLQQAKFEEQQAAVARKSEPLVDKVAATVNKPTTPAKQAEEAIIDKIANNMKGVAKKQPIPEVKPPTTVVPSKNVDIGSAKDMPYELVPRMINGKEVMVKKYKEGMPLYRSFE